MSKRIVAVFAACVLMLASVAAFAQPADPPGNSGNAPGQQESAPGNSENAPGQQEDGPGNSENAPGQQEAAPDDSESAPGQQESAPGQQEDGPGNSEAAHACQQDGYLELAPAESPDVPFENTGDCVSYAAQGGELTELEGEGEDAPEAEIGDEAPVGSPEAVAGTPVVDGPGNSEAAHACQQDGYLELAPAASPDEPFENTGDCVSYAAQGGELVEFEGEVEGTPEADEDEEAPVGSPEASPVA